MKERFVLKYPGDDTFVAINPGGRRGNYPYPVEVWDAFFFKTEEDASLYAATSSEGFILMRVGITLTSKLGHVDGVCKRD